VKNAVAWLATLTVAGSAHAFGTNGRVWPSMPIQVWINPTDCPEMANGDTIIDIVTRATEEWSSVLCADISFEIVSTTTGATWASDGQNTIFCMAEWGFGEGAAGATLWSPLAPPDQEVDLALNGTDFEWREGGGDVRDADVLDPVSVITHELGHWLGLSHSGDPFATMYMAQLPGGIQASLDGDDRAGVCSIYPSGLTECDDSYDCAPDQECATIEGIPVCRDLHDGAGAFCNRDHVDCAEMCWVSFYECSQICLYTDIHYQDGYCAPLCDDVACPAGFVCTYLDQHDVSVCFIDDNPPGDDGGPIEDDGGPTVRGEPDGGCAAVRPLGLVLGLGFWLRRRRLVI